MKNNYLNNFSIEEIRKKMEYYCAYQDRCHEEVYQKLFSFSLSTQEKEELMVYLIENDFLNEERFAKSFVRGKFNYKNWGKIRIVSELKFRKISSTLITIALKEVKDEDYIKKFNELTYKHWESLTESNSLKKRKKFCDYFIRRGWESDLLYEKVKELEK